MKKQTSLPLLFMKDITHTGKEFPLIFYRHIWPCVSWSIVFQTLIFGTPEFSDGFIFVAQLLVADHGFSLISISVKRVQLLHLLHLMKKHAIGLITFCLVWNILNHQISFVFWSVTKTNQVLLDFLKINIKALRKVQKHPANCILN